jgi:hypothetical protein
MGWWREEWLRITHIPTGVSVRVEVMRNSWRKSREKAKAMLRGKLWAKTNDAGPSDRLVRSYDLIDDEANASRILDGGVDIRPLDPKA